MHKLIVVSLVLLLIAACDNAQIAEDDLIPDEFRCDLPKVWVGDRCCLDENKNQICDVDEDNLLDSVVLDDAPVEEIEIPETQHDAEVQYGGDSNAVLSSPEFESVGGVKNYLEVFEFRNTRIIFDIERTKAPIVTATMDILGAFGFADNIESNPMNTKGRKLADFISSSSLDHFILLGNACNNDLIADLYGKDESNCMDGLKEGRPVVRLGRYDRKYVLVVMGIDHDVYAAVGMIVGGKVPYSMQERVVNV